VSTFGRQIFEVGSEGTQVGETISYEYKTRGFRLVRALTWSNSPTFSIDVLCY
jgi:hypothetical protein